MPHPSWHFKKLRPGDTIRNPISGDFFSQDAIEDAAEALVRESIQNSLDARLGSGPVRVRLSIIEGLGKPAQQRIARFFTGLEPHLHSSGNGLDSPPEIEECDRYAVVEDFGTTGLAGETEQWRPVDGMRNDFFSFFRAEGYSSKAGEDKGRWGVGKTVFPRSSLINAYFGLTRRAGTGELLLMGRCILKTHDAIGSIRVPDGYYGIPNGVQDGLAMPIEEPALIEQFAHAFEVSPRPPEQSGLSVVVPFLDPAIDPSKLLRSAVRDYFHPILTGALEVLIDRPGGGAWHVRADTLEGIATDHEELVGPDVLPVIELARWALIERPSPILIPGPPENVAPTWNNTEIPEEILAQARTVLTDEARQAFRVAVTVRRKGADPEASHVDIFLADADTSDRRAPRFVRDGIVISNAAGKRIHGRHALVVIDDLPLATLLGDAENVAHTEWNKDRSQFKERYINAKSYLNFVGDGPAELIKRLTANDDEEDPDLLQDILSIDIPPDPDLEEEEDEGEGAAPGRRTPPSGVGPARRARYRIHRTDGGFRLGPGDPEAEPPDTVRIALAYDLRGRNPLKAWDPADFTVENTPIEVDARKGCVVTERRENVIVVKIEDAGFQLDVSGFDPKRDLYIRALAQAVEGHDDDS